MAAIFQIRRGTTNESLTEGELYLHQGSGSLQFGSGSNNYNVLTLNAPVNGDVILTGNITASNAYFSGDVAISGNLFLGNNTGDNISVPGVFTTNLIPGGNGTLDLGASGAKWKTVYANSISASFTGSVNGINVEVLSSSIDSQFDAISIVSESLNTFTSSQQSINTGYNTFTQSADSRLDNIELTTASLQGEIDSIQAVTASYATTGSNIFVGNQTISGSLTISGSSTFRNIGPTILSGSVLVSGSINSDGFELDATSTTTVAALNSEFNVNFGGSAIVNKTLVLGDSKVLVAGRFSDIDSHTTDDIARFNSNGTIDTSFTAPSIGGGLSATSQVINNFVTQSNDKIIIVGSFTEVDGSSYSGVARLNSNGTLDNTFTNPALTSFTEVRDVIIQNDNKIVVVGNFDGGIKRLNTDGTIDTSLVVNDSTGFTNDSFYAVASQTTGSIDYLLVGGSFLQWDTLTNYKRIVRIGISGSLDSTYAGTNLNITSAGGLVSKIKLDSNNDVYISGRFVGSTNRHRNIAKLITDADYTTTGPGELDSTFATWLSGGTNDGWARDFEIVDGKVLIGGEFGFAGRTQNGTQYSATDFVIVNESDGAPIDNWSSGNYTFNNVVYSVTSLGGNNVLVGGNFSTVNSISREDLASLKTSGIGTITTTSEYNITANTTRLLVSSSNTHFSGDVNIIGSVTASVFSGSFVGTLPSQDDRLNNLEITSASVKTSIAELNTYTSSLKTAITASGTNVTINGNLTVKGTTTQIDSTTLNIGDNIIELNYGGSQTLSGIYTKDATGTLSSGSLLWNSTTDRWIAGVSGSESTILLAGGDSVISSSLQLTDLNAFSQSTNTRLGLLETSTGSLNTFTSSANNRLGLLETSTGSLNTFSSSTLSRLELIETSTGSLNTFSSSTLSRLELLETSTASLNNFSASVTASLESIYQTTASLNNFSASVTASLESIYQTTASINLFSASVTASLESIYQTTASLNSFTGSQLTQNTQLATISGSLIVSASQSYLSASLMTASVTKLREDVDYLYGIGGISGGNPLTPIQEWSASARIQLENLELFTASFSESVSASIASLESSSGYINYVTNSIEQLTGIEVADFDSNVAVTFINGTLKFIFGTPAVPTSIATSLSGFLVDRFNNVNDAYIVNGTWSNQGYTLVSASLYEGSTLLTEVGSGTSLSYNATTSGSHTYRLEYTASSPLDGTLYKTSTTATGTISKSNPASPTISPTVTVQLGASSNQIEQGATGSISFTSSSADPSNGWDLINTTTNVSTPYFVTGSATGSTSISITATANYESPIGDNIPDLTTTSTATTTYTKIRSLRHGASAATSFTEGELENIGAWDTTLGGTIGTIVKGTTTASGQSVTISWTGDKFHYIVFNSSLSNLSNITTSGFGVLGQFSVTTVGQYKVYKTNTLQAGGAGSSITYTLT